MAFASRHAIASALFSGPAAPPAESVAECVALNSLAAEAAAGRGKRQPGTKVVATIGPSIRGPTTLDALLEAGVSCLRLDISCARPLLWFTESYDMVQEAIKRSGRLVALMIDTKGQQEVIVRRSPSTPKSTPLSCESPNDLSPLRIQADQVITLTGDPGLEWSPESPETLPLSDAAFVAGLCLNDTVHVSRYLGTGMEDSSLYLEVQSVSDDRTSAECRAVTSATLEGLITVAKVSKPGQIARPVSPSCLCADDREMIAAFAGKDIDFLALSYTETAEQVLEARGVLDAAGLQDCAILAKVETPLGVRNFEAIMDVADGLIISRGNLGLSVAIEKVCRLQKEMIVRGNLTGKPVLLTRIFDSMTDAPRPTRAEATDVANAVLDGVDGFLLGAETVRGKWPVDVVAQVRRICGVAEKVFHFRRFYDARMEGLDLAGDGQGLGLRISLASTLVRVAEKAAVSLIIVFTKSGRHAQEVAVWRPQVPILALFPPTLRAVDGVRWVLGGRAEARRAMVLRGVMPMLADPKDGLNDDAMLQSALLFAQRAGLVGPDDTVAVSHRLRDDIVISVVRVADVAPLGLGEAPDGRAFHIHKSAAPMERTPSAYDLQRHEQESKK
jgi:pyruvate kinase